VVFVESGKSNYKTVLSAGARMGCMNIAVALKAEIGRLARKELRNETQQLKKAVAGFRSEVAALKRRTLELEKALRGLRKQGRSKAEPPPRDAEGSKLRFTAKGLAGQRKRLSLSAHEVGLLVGTSGQSIYNWESGDTRPRQSHLPAIAALRKMGKKEAAARLEALRAAA
jgi:DNA-binding XRE family transcriptional regulator